MGMKNEETFAYAAVYILGVVNIFIIFYHDGLELLIVM
jgi:hypothetical protein